MLGEEPVAPPGGSGVGEVRGRGVAEAGVGAEVSVGVGAERFEESMVRGVGIFGVGVAVAEEQRYVRECGGEDALGWNAGECDAGGEEFRVQQERVVGGGGTHREADEVDAGGVNGFGAFEAGDEAEEGEQRVVGQRGAHAVGGGEVVARAARRELRGKDKGRESGLDGGLDGSERERAELGGVVRADLAGTVQKDDERKAAVWGDRWAEESVGQSLPSGKKRVADELLPEGVLVE